MSTIRNIGYAVRLERTEILLQIVSEWIVENRPMQSIEERNKTV